MSKLVVITGLPGSGKTERARQIIQENINYVRLNRDDLRKTFFLNKPWLQEEEEVVPLIQHMMCRSLLKLGKNIVIDDLNLNKKTVERYTVLAKECNAEVDFIHLRPSIFQCILRDKKRENPVGAETILKIANEYGLKIDKDAQETIIYFFEEVLADTTQRDACLSGSDKYSKPGWCKSFVPINKFINKLQEDMALGYKITIITDTSQSLANELHEWMQIHNVSCDSLIMRGEKDECESRTSFKFDKLIREDLSVCKRIVVSKWDDIDSLKPLEIPIEISYGN